MNLPLRSLSHCPLVWKFCVVNSILEVLVASDQETPLEMACCGREQVLEVHDCFAITEILMYEAVGLAPKGKVRARSGNLRSSRHL